MGKLYVLDDNTSWLTENLKLGSNDKVIQTQEDWTGFTLSEFELNAVIILCELDWEGKYLQDFYGFNIATELRRKHKLLCPIILTSTLKKSYYERQAKGNIDYNILFSPGLEFIRLDKLQEKVNEKVDDLNQYPLSRATISDMNMKLLNLRGTIIDKLQHDLKPEISEEDVDKIIDEVESYINDKHQLGDIASEAARNNLKSKLGDVDSFEQEQKELIRRCEDEIVDVEGTMDIEYEKRHKIIVLEDDPDFRKKIENNLPTYFEGLFITDKVSKVVQKLNEDEDNSFTAIVADWRLYKDKAGDYWQPWQGYNVMDYAAKNKFIALFSLTSLDDKNVHEIRNKLGLNIHLFKKQYLNNDGRQWDIMADTIKQRCDKVVELIASQPTGATWKRLKPKYIQKRSNNWNEFNIEVSNEAATLFKYYYESVFKGLIDEVRLLDGITEKGFSLKNNLRNVLIIRRVYLALYFSLINQKKQNIQHVESDILNRGVNLDSELKHHSINAYSIVKQDWWDDRGNDSTLIEKEWKNFDQRKTNLLSSLCIKLTDLPQTGIMPEEKKWLRDNNIDIMEGLSLPEDKLFGLDEEDDIENSKKDEFDREPTNDQIQDASNNFSDIINE